MAYISVDNGFTFYGPDDCADALKNVSLDVMAYYMDDDTRERVHNELAPCSDVDFLRRYLELAPYDMIVG